MASFEQDLHRTLVQLLIDMGQRELAAAMIDGGMEYMHDDRGYAYGLYIDVPTGAYGLISGNETLKQTLVKAVKVTTQGHIADTNEPEYKLRVKVISMMEGWENVAREMIVNSKGNNQGAISQMMKERTSKEMLTYNEASYASQSEIRIAQEFEERQVLFFPLAMAVRADTGENYRDHREADFLVCDDGAWGILEVGISQAGGTSTPGAGQPDQSARGGDRSASVGHESM
jgi:hypothetical protein